MTLLVRFRTVCELKMKRLFIFAAVFASFIQRGRAEPILLNGVAAIVNEAVITYKEVFTVFFPLIEMVMDAGKVDVDFMSIEKLSGPPTNLYATHLLANVTVAWKLLHGPEAFDLRLARTVVGGEVLDEFAGLIPTVQAQDDPQHLDHLVIERLLIHLRFPFSDRAAH